MPYFRRKPSAVEAIRSSQSQTTISLTGDSFAVSGGWTVKEKDGKTWTCPDADFRANFEPCNGEAARALVTYGDPDDFPATIPFPVRP